MAGTPSVLFLSCSDTVPDDIIRLLLDVSSLPEKIQIEKYINAFPWIIDNKYYTAKVNLCSLQKKSICTKEFSETVQAVVLHFDSSSNDAIDKINSWLPFINEYEPEIKILLCKNIKNDDKVGCTKQSVQEWCLGKGFELVELDPIIEDDDDDDDLEDDFPETTGIKRIIQALNAHVWPNLKMKDSEQRRTPLDDIKTELNSIRQQLRIEDSPEESLDEMLQNDDDFSKLLSQLTAMKARVASLSGDDRKAAAEEVVQAFLRALGGQEDESLDL